MTTVDDLLGDDPQKWILELPEYQREPIAELIRKGSSFEEVAQLWVTASASNTYRLGAAAPVGDRNAFLANLKAELRAYLCGDKRYKKERDDLFGEKGLTRTYVVSALAVAISAHVNVAAPVLAPAIALVLASLGKIALNAWCDSSPPPTMPVG